MSFDDRCHDEIVMFLVHIEALSINGTISYRIKIKS